MSSDIDAVLEALTTDGLVEGVWQDNDGHIDSTIVDENAFPELTAQIRSAPAAALLSVYATERTPRFTAVMPDNDGVLRARWRTEPTPSDRNWALRHPKG
ncbi:hypothetical protein ACWCQW_25875 [Streptomyces mirabilis]